MSRSSNGVKGLVLLNIAVAIYLFATGIMGVTGRSGGGEIGTAVRSLFASSGSGDFNKVLIVILSVMAIAAGVFIIIRIFGVSITHTDTLLIILAIVWLIFILMIDVIYPLNNKGSLNLEWFRRIGSHAMALAGIILGTERFGI